jgi:hypothetical protein
VQVIPIEGLESSVRQSGGFGAQAARNPLPTSCMARHVVHTLTEALA